MVLTLSMKSRATHVAHRSFIFRVEGLLLPDNRLQLMLAVTPACALAVTVPYLCFVLLICDISGYEIACITAHPADHLLPPEECMAEDSNSAASRLVYIGVCIDVPPVPLAALPVTEIPVELHQMISSFSMISATTLAWYSNVRSDTALRAWSARRSRAFSCLR